MEDLLHANVLPHLPHAPAKMTFLAHMVGILLNAIFDPTQAHLQQYDKDFLGNKRMEVCGTLAGAARPPAPRAMAQQLRNALCPRRRRPHAGPGTPTACRGSWSGISPRR